ncbi:MAG: hypothetical protein QOH30_2564 [Baekduia sp.]|jgi:hypothetical protein|nr:hypothetical protein [Baekduia sp.]
MADRLAGELERQFQASRWRAENDLVSVNPGHGTCARLVHAAQAVVHGLDRAGVHHITFHGLRHVRTGHAASSTTEIYAPDPTGGVAFAHKAFGDPVGALPGGGAAAGVLSAGAEDGATSVTGSVQSKTNRCC